MLGLRTPADKAGPAVQPQQFAGEIRLTMLLGDAKGLHDVNNRSVCARRQIEDALDRKPAQKDAAVAPGNIGPGSVKAMLSTVLTPRRLIFVEKVQSALDYQLVELGSKVGSPQSIDALGQRPPGRQVVAHRGIQAIPDDGAAAAGLD